MIMKKFVSIVLTTGLLMGTVAFSALACDRGDGPDRVQEQGQKWMGQHERYQPPMGPQGHREKMVLRGNRPGPAPARCKEAGSRSRTRPPVDAETGTGAT
jgi:hypothetical protein